MVLGRGLGLGLVDAIKGARGHGDTGTRGEAALKGRSERMMGPASGRAVIAMTAVRIRTCVEPGKLTDFSNLRPPTDVMAITSLPPELRQ